MRVTVEMFGHELVISLGLAEPAEEDEPGECNDLGVSHVAGSHDAAPAAATEHEGYLMGFRAPTLRR